MRTLRAPAPGVTGDKLPAGQSPAVEAADFHWAPAWRHVGLLVLVSWVPLLVLTSIRGLASGGNAALPLLSDQAVAVRFLIAAPVLILAQAYTHARTLELAHQLTRSGFFAVADVPRFERIVHRLNGWRDSKVALGVIALLVLIGAAIFSLESGESSAWQFVSGPSGSTRSLAGWWYVVVSIPIFQFLLAYGAWRYAVWCLALFRISRFQLVLVPTHPDRAAGLSIIAHAHQNFATVAFALSSILSVYIGSQVVEAGRTLSDYYLYLGAFVAMALVVLLGPLLVFTPALIRARRNGLLMYGTLAARYTREFHGKWIGQEPQDEPLMGSADIQSLADLGNSYQIVREMRMVPFDIRTIVTICLWSLAPLFPLAFAAFSPLEVLKGLAGILL
jgi:hypothetical protein